MKNKYKISLSDKESKQGFQLYDVSYKGEIIGTCSVMPLLKESVDVYEIEKNGNEVFHKQFFNDIQRIYQLLVDNAKTNATTLTGSGNNTSSKKLTWVNGVCDDYTINEFVGEEEEIDGLNVCRFNFNCIIIRTN